MARVSVSYNPGAVPEQAPRALKAWLADELRRIAVELNQGLYAPPIGAEPPRLRNGMIVYAVDPWATTLGAEGFYGYENGAWVKLYV
jgi:hypothetical protein